MRPGHRDSSRCSTMALTAGSSPDEVPQSTRGLVLLIASGHIAQVLAGVAVVAGLDAAIDLVAQRLGARDAHGVATHPEPDATINRCEHGRICVRFEVACCDS